ncbi:MAG TPA: ATP-binding protein [Caulobacteraceae bacterium]
MGLSPRRGFLSDHDTILMAAISVLGAICVAIGAFAVWSLHATGDRHEQLDETYASMVVTAYDLKAEEDHGDSLEPLFVLTGDPAFVGRIAASHDRFDTILERLRRTNLPPEAAQRLAQIKDMEAQLRAAQGRGEAMRLGGASADETDAYVRTHAGPLARAIRTELGAFVDETAHTYAHEKHRDQQLTHDYLALAWAGGALALPLMVGIGYAVQRAMARRRLREAAAARAAERERETSEARKTAIEVVAHDLRNPLAAILFSAEDLLADPRVGATPDLRQRIQTLSDAAGAMNRLIHNVLDETRIDTGSLVLNRRPTDLAELLPRVLAQFSASAERKGVDLTAEAADDARAMVDPDRVEQVLCNLTANALRFTPPGGKVSIAAARDKDRLVLRVADTGFGIAPEDQPRIFDRYWQDRHGARQGAGLGLSICRAIVEAHSGVIDVDSRPGDGSTFTVTLPG